LWRIRSTRVWGFPDLYRAIAAGRDHPFRVGAESAPSTQRRRERWRLAKDRFKWERPRSGRAGPGRPNAVGRLYHRSSPAIATRRRGGYRGKLPAPGAMRAGSVAA
jgi:hypothetical protein